MSLLRTRDHAGHTVDRPPDRHCHSPTHPNRVPTLTRDPRTPTTNNPTPPTPTPPTPAPDAHEDDAGHDLCVRDAGKRTVSMCTPTMGVRRGGTRRGGTRAAVRALGRRREVHAGVERAVRAGAGRAVRAWGRAVHTGEGEQRTWRGKSAMRRIRR